MKTHKKQIIKQALAEFSRGFVCENSHGDFFNLVIRASIGDKDEDYDYSNWTEDDLKDLADAIYWILKNKRQAS